MFRYRLHSPDGDGLGEATYAVMIKPDEERRAGRSEGATNSATRDHDGMSRQAAIN